MSHKIRMILFGVVAAALAATIAIREFRGIGRASSVPLATVLKTVLDPIEAGEYATAYARLAPEWRDRQTTEGFVGFVEATFVPLGDCSALRQRDTRFRDALGQGRIADASFDVDYGGQTVTVRGLFVEGDDLRWRVSGLEAYGQGKLLGRSVPSER